MKIQLRLPSLKITIHIGEPMRTDSDNLLTEHPISEIIPERPDVPVSEPTDLFPRKTDNHEGLDVPPSNE